MKKRILILISCLATVLLAGLALAGCDWLALFNPSHSHSPSSDWQANSTHHWHKCTEESCSEQLDKEQHTSSFYVSTGEGHYKICSVCGERYDEGTHVDGEACLICGYNPGHTHSLEYVAEKAATCTTDGNVGYWHCTSCQKNYSDEEATIVLTSVEISSTGHISVSKYNATTHWQECDKCRIILEIPEAHTSATYIKNKEGHYKNCSVCGVKFDEATHNGEECLTCGYTPDYTDMCASDYGYNYLGTLENGVNYQSFYKKMDEAAKAFHTDGNKNASPVTISGDIVYVAGQINYSSLGLTVEQAQCVWATYRHDHPLYYWLLGQVVYSTQTLSLCVDSDYISGTQRAAKNQEIYTAIDGYLKAVEGETSAYQIAFAFHDMIIDKIDYAYDESGNPETANYAHSILGVLDGTAAVCEGYAKAYALLLNASGIENVYVTGSSKGVGHAWNMVKIGDGWYWYDLTWDDQPTANDGTIYTYMCQAGETFADHTVNTTGDMSAPMNFLYAIPEASTVAYNTASIEYGEQFTLSGVTYEVCGYNEVSIVKSSSLSGAVVLTSNVTYDGRVYTLTQIGTGAFKNNRQITSLTIPSTVKVIYNFAVNGCSNLNSVTFEDKVGWSRMSNNGTEQIAETSLENTSSAATLLKETYKVLFTSYEYIWVKSPSE